MSLQQLLDHEIFTRSEIAGFPRFKRASLIMNYEGQNTLGNHNGDLTVNFYEPFANENCVVTIFNEPGLKSILQPQLTADKLPDFFVMPDFYHNLDDFNDGTVSHSAYIWDKSVANIEVNLAPYYDLQKFIFVHKRYANFRQANEVHMLVNPLKL